MAASGPFPCSEPVAIRNGSAVVALSSAFLSVAIAGSFSSEAYAARRGSMSGVDNTYGSQKGQKCQGGVCTPAAQKKKKPG